MEFAKNAPIGVLDSGVGGLSVLKCLHQFMPQENYVYIGDTARTPYGVRPEAQLREFIEEMLCWLEKQGVKQVVVACNTLTMLGVDTLKKDHPFDIVGMSKGEKILLHASKKKNVAVFATPFTIGTEAHKKAIQAVDPSAIVTGIPCPDFVTLVEAEKLEGPEIEAAIESHAQAVRDCGADALILSCTHFPFVKEKIEENLGSSIKVIDPAEATSMQSKDLLEDEGLLNDTMEAGKMRVCCTGDLGALERLASRMLPVAQCTFEKVTL